MAKLLHVKETLAAAMLRAPPVEATHVQVFWNLIGKYSQPTYYQLKQKL